MDDWHTPQVAPRHQVLVVSARPGGPADLLPDPSGEPWPRQGLPLPRDGPDGLLERFDGGVVPCLLRLALAEPAAATLALDELAHMASAASEVAAEILRSQLSAVRALGHSGLPRAAAAAAAARLEAACRRSVRAAGDEQWHQEPPELKDQHWLGFGSQHYVVRFAAPDGATPPTLARVAVFGRSDEEAKVSGVSRIQFIHSTNQMPCSLNVFVLCVLIA